MTDEVSVREITKSDIELIADYWTMSDPSFMLSMGVDVAKIPPRPELVKMLEEQLSQRYDEKKSYAIVWLVNGKPAGHSNVNNIVFGEEAQMHLHLWNALNRQKGLGMKLMKMTIPYFFSNLHLKTIFCEPYAINPAPNQTLRKLGFEFVKRYVTTPGHLNFEQEVNRWEITIEKYRVTI